MGEGDGMDMKVVVDPWFEGEGAAAFCAWTYASLFFSLEEDQVEWEDPD